MHSDLQRLAKIARQHPRIALRIYQQIETSAKNQGDYALQLDALYQRYFTLERIGEAATIEAELKLALTFAEENALAWQAGRLFEALGRIHYTRSEYRDALQYWTRCIDTSLLTGDIASGIEARIGLSQISNELGDPGQGTRYFQDAEQLIDKIDNPYLASKLAINIGVNHFYYPNELEQSEAQFLRGLHYATVGNIKEYIAESHWHLGHVYLEQNQLDAANSSVHIALSMAEKCSYPWLRGVCYDTLAQILFKQKDFATAQVHCEMALLFAKESNSLFQQVEHLRLLISIHELNGNLAQAMQYVHEMHTTQTKMNLLSAPDRLQVLNKYDLTQKSVSEQLLELAADPEINLGQQASLQLLLNEAARILQLDWIGIWILNNHTMSYECKAQANTSSPISIFITSDKTPSYRHFIQHISQAVIAPDARLHPAAGEMHAIFGEHTPQSSLDFPLQTHNQPIGMVSFFQIKHKNIWQREDILHCSHLVHLIERVFANTERDKIQSELQRNEKMASLGRLVAGIAHEINTPIGIGVTASSTLHSELKQIDAEIDSGKLGKNRLLSFVKTAMENVLVTERNLQRAAELVKSFKEIAVDQNSDIRRRINVSDYLNEILLNLSPSVKHTPYRWIAQCNPSIEVD
ncbi:MAG: GAF domain-containing protein, partial [Deefgea sp.]